jgi:hypothetical protein
MTHAWSPELEAEFLKFFSLDYPGSPDVWLLLDSRTPGAGEIARRFPRCHIIVESEMFSRLPYPRLDNGRLYEHVHFPILDFFHTHPGYDYYWVVEFDVRYTGDWGSFLRAFEPCHDDLITSHIRRFHEEPAFWWWYSLDHPTETIDRARYLRSFNVIYRISHRALALIHDKQQNGWRGYPEVSLPTFLDTSGYTLLDIGGNGEFTPPYLKNRFYTSGSAAGLLNPFCTIRWRPSRSRAGIRRNKLYHPVKPGAMREPLGEKIQFFRKWIGEYIGEKLRRPTVER